MPDYVPAIRGRMGDWTYYVTAMKLAKVAREVRFAEDIHSHSELDELIQRKIGDRVKKEMVPYLLNQPQRFYGSIIVAVYGGEPEFSPVTVAEHELINDDERSSYGFGLLRFDGSQQYFALDGQHRLKSIELALKDKPDLGREEVTVIIVKHENNAEGLARTRRLFSTLNRRAEKTKVGLNIAIDEDDPTAICTRRLVREHPYLGAMGLVKADEQGLNSKQLSTGVKDQPYFTTLQTLYECSELLLTAYEGGMDIDQEFRQNRPDSDTLDAYYEYLSDLWMKIFDLCPDLAGVRTGREKPGTQRIDKRFGGGGSVIVRPIGQLALCDALADAMRDGMDSTMFLTRFFGEVSLNLDDAPWKKLVWNPEARAIAGGKKERTLAGYLILHKFGVKIPVKQRQLLEDYRKATQDKTVKLLRVATPEPEEAADAAPMEAV